MLSSPVTVELAEVDLVNMNEVKTFLRLDEGSLDTEVEGYIASAIGDVELMTGTRLAPQTVEILADRFADLQTLSIGPVQSVISIEYQDTGGDTHVLASDAFELFGAGLARGIRLKAGQSWPLTRYATGVIAVRLSVGYDPLPGHLKRTLLELIRSRFDGTPIDLFTMTVNDRIWA